MIARPVTWSRALSALSVACVSVLALAFVAANFVLVDVRFWVLDVQLRLGWAVVGAAGVGFAAGALWTTTARAAPTTATLGRSAPRRRSHDTHEDEAA